MYLDWKRDPKRYWVVDTEGDGLYPTQMWCAVAQNMATNEVLEFDTEAMYDGRFKRFLSDTSTIICGHNFISYDAYHLTRLGVVGPIDIGRIVDTLVLSYLYHPYLPGGHSVEAYGERFGIPKISHEDWSHFSPQMMARCRRDVELQTLIYKGLCERMNKIGFSEKSCEIEHRIRDVIDRQQRRGFHFNVGGATALIGQISDSLRSLEGPIKELFPPVLTAGASYQLRRKRDGTPYHSYERHRDTHAAIRDSADGSEYTVYDYEAFDIGSPQQRVKKLLSLGWEPTELTPGGKPKVNEESLKRFADTSGIPEINAIADWVVLSSRKSTLESWLRFTGPDSRIHGQIFTCGAQTRRMRHGQPNTANIPSEANGAFMGAEMRSLWDATPGRVLMGYDASGLEMRGFLHYIWPNASDSDRKMLLDLYVNGKPHQRNADALTEALGFEVVYGGGGAKTLFYAFLYGAGDPKLGKTLGKGPDVGKKVRAALMSAVPGLKGAVDNVQEEFQSNGGLIRTIDGGYVRGTGEHSALNYQIQSAGGIVMKEAAIIFDKKIKDLGLDIWKVGDIHDESQQDCPTTEEAHEAGKAGTASITEAGETLGFNVPLAGEYKVGANWHETH